MSLLSLGTTATVSLNRKMSERRFCVQENLKRFPHVNRWLSWVAVKHYVKKKIQQQGSCENWQHQIWKIWRMRSNQSFNDYLLWRKPEIFVFVTYSNGCLWTKSQNTREILSLYIYICMYYYISVLVWPDRQCKGRSQPGTIKSKKNLLLGLSCLEFCTH